MLVIGNANLQTTIKSKIGHKMSQLKSQLGVTAEYPATRSEFCVAGLRGTQWVIYAREEVVLVAGYAVRGTQWVIYAREEVVLVAGYAVRGTQWVIYAREEVVLVAGYAVRGTQWVICARRGSCHSSWLRGTRYAVSDICKGRSCLSSWLRGTRVRSEWYMQGRKLS